MVIENTICLTLCQWYMFSNTDFTTRENYIPVALMWIRTNARWSGDMLPQKVLMNMIQTSAFLAFRSSYFQPNSQQFLG